MAKNRSLQDDDWLLLMQVYLQKPIGMKPLYSRALVELGLELHISPQELFARQCDIANRETTRVQHLWQKYGEKPGKLKRAVERLRRMRDLGSNGDFYDGVEVEETFEHDFRPLAEDHRLMPVMLILILDLYFRLTPLTMVTETPEVQELASMMGIPAQLVVDVMKVFLGCDPYLNRYSAVDSPLRAPCQQAWQHYGNIDTQQLASYAEQLKEYFK